MSREQIGGGREQAGAQAEPRWGRRTDGDPAPIAGSLGHAAGSAARPRASVILRSW
jgi:hypothetical protein